MLPGKSGREEMRRDDVSLGQEQSFYLHDEPRLPVAWGPWFSHEYIAYFAVQAVSRIMDLPPVPVKPRPVFTNIEWPQGPDHVDLYKEAYEEGEKHDLFTSFEYGIRNAEYGANPPTHALIEPWKVIVIYSTEPDLDPDCGLQLHRLQKITGGSHGWRHMQFNDLGFTVGAVTESLRAHRDMAREAFLVGNDYWGWRYLSRATHYLADMGHPFHVKSAPRWYLVKNLLRFRELFKVVSAIHTGYEVYSERRFREGFPPFREALLNGARQGLASGGEVDAGLKEYMLGAKARLGPIFRFMLDQFGRELVDVYGSVRHDGASDVSNQTKLCSGEAVKVLFQEKHRDGLGFLDTATEAILFDVGRMLGMLLSGCER
jgi:hypothetical protein